MRAPLLIAAFLAVSACGKNAQVDNSVDSSEQMTADSIVANDVTAIDAVTADAANMAADVDYTDALANLSNNSDAAAEGNAARPKAADAAGNSE